MYIIHLGFSAFPIEGNAPVQRVRLTFMGLKLEGYYVLIINKLNIGSKKYKSKLNRHQGIPFIFTSFLTHRHNSFLVRNLNKFTGYFGELILLTKKRKKIHTAILYTSSFGELFYYRLLSRLLGFKLIMQYVELRSSLSVGVTLYGGINDKLFDRFFYKFCDGVIAISDFLVKHVESKTQDLPLIKLPAICDFNEFNIVKSIESPSYIMYCGSILYYEIIEFIIDLFISLKDATNYDGNLVLVISGNYEINWVKLQSKIKYNANGKEIILKSHIPFTELMALYKTADVLMIPLRNTLQDIARFPHKIGEYSASGRPILTTNLGEPKLYFEDEVSAILAEEFSQNSYLQKLTALVSSKEKLDKIGIEGYKIGINNFDYRAQGKGLSQFILDL